MMDAVVEVGADTGCTGNLRLSRRISHAPDNNKRAQQIADLSCSCVGSPAMWSLMHMQALVARAADCNPQEVSNAYWCVRWPLTSLLLDGWLVALHADDDATTAMW